MKYIASCGSKTGVNVSGEVSHTIHQRLGKVDEGLEDIYENAHKL
jgi:hypothetical protein